MAKTNNIQVIGHRGFSQAAPENTLAATKAAIEAGADYVEMDVRMTADGVPVLLHDKTIDRTTSGSGNINELTLQEVRHYHAGYSKKFGNLFTSQRIPTVEEFLRFSRSQTKVCLELKEDGAEESVIESIEKLGMEQQVIIFSYAYHRLHKVKELNAEIPLLHLSLKPSHNHILETVELGGEYVGLGNDPGPNIIGFAHLYDIQVFRYTVNEPYHMQYLIQQNIDGIITDVPHILCDVKAGLFKK